MSKQPEIIVYTDGGCLTPEGPGGWAWRAEYPDGTVKEAAGGDPCTTNNRMEMTAAIMAMEALPWGARAMLTTDSQYLQQGFMTWWRGWVEKGWRTSTGAQVKNRELWERMLGARKNKQIRMTWVKGHNGNPGNVRVDQLAAIEIDRLTGRVRSAERKGKRIVPRCPDCRSMLRDQIVNDRRYWFCENAHNAQGGADAADRGRADDAGIGDRQGELADVSQPD